MGTSAKWEIADAAWVTAQQHEPLNVLLALQGAGSSVPAEGQCRCEHIVLVLCSVQCYRSQAAGGPSKAKGND